MANLYAKNFSDADEVKNPPKAKVEVVKLGNVNASKLVLEPGWKWSTCIKPTVGGDSCQAGHVGVVISGSMTCTHDDGSEITVGAGDALLAYSSLTLKVSNSLVAATIIGSIAAACECEIDGNEPINSSLVLKKMSEIEKQLNFSS